MGILAEDVERVRAAANIVEVVSPYVALRRVGRQWAGLCPFHTEKSGSFYVSEDKGVYRCHGCQKGGDVFRFVQEVEHCGFTEAVERLAGKYGITLRYTTSGESHERKRRKELVEAMAAAVDWYHERLLRADDAGPARAYLRSRGIGGDDVRRYRLGWAPGAWDALVRALRLSPDIARDTGLGFENRRGGITDFFRNRLLFPIHNEHGEPVAFGGRLLPGVDGPKYKNSPESRIYAKSRTLYGLDLAKAAIVTQGDHGEVVVCEGYTDVIGFHQAGVDHAVATCGTALTAEHVQLLARFARRVVLAFDADAAGQQAAARFYEWEKQFGIEVAVARLPAGQDPADVARRDPEGLRAAVTTAMPFLGFRVDRLLSAARLDTPERRARAAEEALAAVNEHPNPIVRRDYAGQVAMRTGLPVEQLVALAERGTRTVRVTAPAGPGRVDRDRPDEVVLWLLIHRWDDTAPLVTEALFDDPVVAEAVRALAAAEGRVQHALGLAGDEAADLLVRLSVADSDAEPAVDVPVLVRRVARRELDRWTASGGAVAEPMMAGDVRTWIDQLMEPRTAVEAATRLLGWLDGRIEERA